MKCTTTFALAASILPAVEGLSLRRGTDGGKPRVISMDTQRRTITTNPHERDKLRRRGTVQASLDNEETLYFINATLGTPAQSLRLHLDTGSSDLWVNTPSSKLCLQKSAPCAFAGTYSANSSSTYEYVGSWFNISYVDGSGASGDYVTDTLTFGSSTVSALQFGVGYSSTSAQGIMGVGYEVNEVQVGRAGLQSYANLPAKMTADGMISSSAYSLWLNDLDSNTGNILFGGVDTAKYTGELQTLPLQAEGGVYAEFLITMTGISMGTTTIASNQALAVLLDSGSSLTYLPDSWVSQMYDLVSAQYDSSEGAAYIPCSMKNSSQTVTFTFSAPTIAVEMNELILDLVTSSGKRPLFQDGTEACLFGVAPAGSGTNVLGDTFLRSAYVVYDLANNEISLAQTNFNSTTSNVLEIGTGTDSVPSATAVANSVAATNVASSSSGISSGGLNIENAAPLPLTGGRVGVALVFAALAGVAVTLL